MNHLASCALTYSESVLGAYGSFVCSVLDDMWKTQAAIKIHQSYMQNIQ